MTTTRKQEYITTSNRTT